MKQFAKYQQVPIFTNNRRLSFISYYYLGLGHFMLWSLLGLSLALDEHKLQKVDEGQKVDEMQKSILKEKSILFGLGLSGILFLGWIHRSARVNVSDLALINAASTLRIRNNRIFGKNEYQYPVKSVLFKTGKYIQISAGKDTFYLKNGTILNEAALKSLLESTK
jgi:hypothetical protein